jgi:ATP-dependent Clp protease ATP-binding subunit ClpC
MFERFTDRARRVVVLAQEEARDLDHNYIGTEHLLLGLCHEGAGVAALEALGVSLAAVREQVEVIVGRGGQPPSGHIPFTPRAKKVLELSLRESQQLGHDYIGTEHLLLGLIREGQGVAAQVLGNLGVDLGRARRQVIELLGGGPGSAVAEGEAAVRIRSSRAQLEEILSRLGAIDARLAALERHLGLAGGGCARLARRRGRAFPCADRGRRPPGPGAPAR